MMSSLAIREDGTIFGWGFGSKGGACMPSGAAQSASTPQAFAALRAQTPAAWRAAGRAAVGVATPVI